MLRVELNVSTKTIEAYSSDIKRYLSFLADKESVSSLESINQGHIRNYVKKLSDLYLAPASIARMVTSVRSYHQFLSKEKIPFIKAEEYFPFKLQLISFFIKFDPADNIKVSETLLTSCLLYTSDAADE